MASSFKMCAIVALAGSASFAAAGSVITSQDFEGNTLSPGRSSVGSDFNNDNPVGQGTGEFWDSGTGWAWTTSYSDFRNQNPSSNSTPLLSSDTDLFGVRDGSNDFSSFPFSPPSNNLADAANADGQYWMAEDADGYLWLLMDPVDVSDYTDLELSFDLAINNTQYGNPDRFSVHVTSTPLNIASFISVATTETFAIAQSGLDAPNIYSDNFSEVTIDLSSFSGSTVYVAFGIGIDSDNETIGIDNVTLTGVPTPGVATLFGLAGLTAARRRRN